MDKPKPDPLPLGESLRVGVRTSGRSQRQIALAVGMTPPALSRFLNGHRDLELATAEKVAEALGLELVRVTPEGGFERIVADPPWLTEPGD